jgi:exodeoxyribonuclease VII large subunit
LFDERHKQPLPTLPRRIGVITSPTGAAIRDILHVLKRRFPAIPVLIYPVPVQGETAPREIAQAIRLAGARGDCDVLIVARGGGSLEDLWAFNDEGVARAIFDCPIPVVSGVGHEVDFTIADFVADERAPTPSGAAERVAPDRAEWLRRVEMTGTRIAHAMRRRLAESRAMLTAQERGLARNHPGARLREHAQRLDELEGRLALAAHTRLDRARDRLSATRALLARASPAIRVVGLRIRLESSQRALAAAGRTCLNTPRSRLDLAMRTLHAVSPLATLDRGYAIVTDAGGHVLQDATDAQPGDTIGARLSRGSVRAQVLTIQPAKPATKEFP